MLDIASNSICPTDTKPKMQSQPGLINNFYFCDATNQSEKASYWKVIECANVRPTNKYFQVILGYKKMIIFCMNQNITWEKKNYTCPDYPFEGDPMDTFTIGNFNWSVTQYQLKEQYLFDIQEKILRSIGSEVPALELLDMPTIELKTYTFKSPSELTYTVIAWLEEHWMSIITLSILIATIIFILC